MSKFMQRVKFNKFVVGKQKLRFHSNGPLQRERALPCKFVQWYGWGDTVANVNAYKQNKRLISNIKNKHESLSFLKSMLFFSNTNVHIWY